MPCDMSKAVNQFAVHAAGERWDTFEGALNHCGEASASFVTALRFHRIDAKLVTLKFNRRLLDDDGPPWRDSEHCVVRVCDVYYDWTYRQFYPATDWPRITNRESLEQEGWQILSER